MCPEMGGHVPTDHKTRHQSGGRDEISVASLAGLLADAQTPLAHLLGSAYHSADTLANLNALISDATLDDSSDTRTPAAHKTSHQSGGADEVSLAALSGTPAALATHEADIDVHMPDLFQLLRTGAYIYGKPWGARSTLGLAANYLYATPHFVARAITIDRLAIEVTAAGAAGTKARLGIYANGTNLYPGALELDAGLVNVDGTGIQAVTISPGHSLSKGLYFMVIVSDGTPTIRGCTYSWSPLGAYPIDFAETCADWLVAFTYAALPDPFTAGGSLNVHMFSVLPRIESLD